MANFQEGLRLTNMSNKSGDSPIAAENYILAAEKFVRGIQENEMPNMTNVAVVLEKAAECLNSSANIINEHINKTTSETIGLPADNIEISFDNLFTDETTVTMDSIIGMRNAKQALEEALAWPIKYPTLKTWKSLLVYGPTGSGKSLICRVAAEEFGWNYIRISASQILSKWVGDSVKNLKKYFDYAVTHQPCVLVFDDGEWLMGNHNFQTDDLRFVKAKLLDQIRSIPDDAKVVVIGCSSLPHLIDDTVLAKLEKKVYVPLPTRNERKLLITKWLLKFKNIMEMEVIDQLSKLTERYTGEEIEIIISDTFYATLKLFERTDDTSDVNVGDFGRVELDKRDLFRQAMRRCPVATKANISKFEHFHAKLTGSSFQNEEYLTSEDIRETTGLFSWVRNLFSSPSSN